MTNFVEISAPAFEFLPTEKEKKKKEWHFSKIFHTTTKYINENCKLKILSDFFV